MKNFVPVFLDAKGRIAHRSLHAFGVEADAIAYVEGPAGFNAVEEIDVRSDERRVIEVAMA